MCFITHNNFLCSLRHHHIIIYFLLFFISSPIKDKLVIEGRRLATPEGPYDEEVVKEEKAILRAQIGSRPPRCYRRCSSCGPCEAIQVPTNPNIRNGGENSTTVSTITYARGDVINSNYKPMSWKCKCGSMIFNP